MFFEEDFYYSDLDDLPGHESDIDVHYPDEIYDYFEVANALVIRHTQKALLVEIPIEIGKGRYWLPKSAVYGRSQVFAVGTSGTLLISRWFSSAWFEKTK